MCITLNILNSLSILSMWNSAVYSDLKHSCLQDLRKCNPAVWVWRPVRYKPGIPRPWFWECGTLTWMLGGYIIGKSLDDRDLTVWGKGMTTDSVMQARVFISVMNANSFYYFLENICNFVDGSPLYCVWEIIVFSALMGPQYSSVISFISRYFLPRIPQMNLKKVNELV